MFKKPTKKQFIIRRIILSSIATLAVISIATVAILSMLGYRLDNDNGRLEQGALLQFDSSPNGANVFIDGVDTGSRTGSKKTVVAGTHTVEMTKPGYEKWSRTLGVEAGTLTWLDYARLVPTERKVTQVAKYEKLSGLTFSPDRKWALAHEDVSSNVLSLVDLRSETVKSSELVIPEGSYSESLTDGVSHSFSVDSWDTGGRYVLVRHAFKDSTEWLVVDTQNAQQTVNVTTLLSVGFKDVKFAGTNGKVLYGLTDDGTLRKVDVSAATISRAFVSHVESFNIFDKTILSYVGIDPADATKRVAGVYRDGDESPHILHTAASIDMPVRIATGEYSNDSFVAISENNEVTILKGRYPSSSAQDSSSLSRYASFKLGGAVSSLSFSADGDYVLAQSGSEFKSYEIERKSINTGMISTTDGATPANLKWLSIAQLWSSNDGSIVMRDFDGGNVFSIMKSAKGYDATLSQNGRFLYSVGEVDGGYTLQRVKMIID